MNEILFYLTKSGRIVFSQHTPLELWIDFFNDKSNKIPDVIIAEIDDVFKQFENGLTIENCSECHVLYEEKSLEKICTNLSDEELKWKKIKGDINK